MAGRYTDIVTVYRPTQSVSHDLTVVPSQVALVGPVLGNLHRGTEKSRSTVNTLGIFNVNSGNFFTGVDNADKVGDRYVLADGRGQYWVVHGVPAYRNRWPETAHIRAVITLLKVKPSGIP